LFAIKLGQLFAERTKSEEYEILSLPIDEISPNPNQPRRIFEREALLELSESIKQLGILQPVCVRRLSGGYELISGERRLRAAKMAELSRVPAIVFPAGDTDSAYIALVENLQRQNLSFFEEARGYRNLIDDYGLSVEEIAKKLGKSRSGIANKLRLLKLTPGETELIVKSGLTERHARALLRIPDERQRIKALKEIIARDYNVRKTEEYIERIVKALRCDEDAPAQHERIIRKAGDARVYTNTVLESVEIIRKWGVDATCDIEERDSFYEIMIKIPFV